MNIQSQQIDIAIVRGDTQALTIVFTDENDDPVDLAGKEVRLTVKRDKTDIMENAVLSKLINTFTDATGGVCEITITSTDTQDIEPGDYYYDVEYREPTPNPDVVYTPIYGTFSIIYDITQV